MVKSGNNIERKIGELDGKIEEGFDNMKKDIDVLFKKLDNLPHRSQGERITKLETRMKDMLKTRYIALTALISFVIYVLAKGS